MSKQILSTFDNEMQNAAFREKFQEEYKEFLLSELGPVDISFSQVKIEEIETKSLRILACNRKK